MNLVFFKRNNHENDSNEWDKIEKALTHKYIQKIPSNNPKRPWNYIYPKDLLHPLKALMSIFGVSEKKLNDDYEKNNIKQDYNCDKNTFAQHVLEYFRNKGKWNKFFSEKSNRDATKTPTKENKPKAEDKSKPTGERKGAAKVMKDGFKANRSLMRKVWAIYNPVESTKADIADKVEDAGHSAEVKDAVKDAIAKVNTYKVGNIYGNNNVSGVYAGDNKIEVTYSKDGSYNVGDLIAVQDGFEFRGRKAGYVSPLTNAKDEEPKVEETSNKPGYSDVEKIVIALAYKKEKNFDPTLSDYAYYEKIKAKMPELAEKGELYSTMLEVKDMMLNDSKFQAAKEYLENMKKDNDTKVAELRENTAKINDFQNNFNMELSGDATSYLLRNMGKDTMEALTNHMNEFKEKITPFTLNNLDATIEVWNEKIKKEKIPLVRMYRTVERDYFESLKNQESEQEEHQNRSEAMMGNQNARKYGLTDEEYAHLVTLVWDNLNAGSPKSVKEILNNTEEFNKLSDELKKEFSNAVFDEKVTDDIKMASERYLQNKASERQNYFDTLPEKNVNNVTLNSKKDVNDFIKNNIADNIDLSNVKESDVKAIEPILNQIADRLKRLGLSKFKGIKFSGRNKDVVMAVDGSTGELSINLNLVKNPKKLWESEQKYKEKQLAEMQRFHPKENYTLENVARWSAFADENDVIRSTVDHEIGHYLLNSKSGKFYNIINKLNDTRNGYDNFTNATIGMYHKASLDSLETVAELFAMYMGKERTLLPKEIIDTIESITGIQPIFEESDFNGSGNGGNNNGGDGNEPKKGFEKINNDFNDDIEKLKNGELDDKYKFKLGKPSDILLQCGFPNDDIELLTKQLKLKMSIHNFLPDDIKDLPLALQEPLAVFTYGDAKKSQNVIVNLNKDGKNFVVGIHFNQVNGQISDIRGLFNKDNQEWLNWINQGKARYLNKNKLQKLINQQRTNLAEVEYLDLKPIDNLLQQYNGVNDLFLEDDYLEKINRSNAMQNNQNAAGKHNVKPKTDSEMKEEQKATEKARADAGLKKPGKNAGERVSAMEDAVSLNPNAENYAYKDTGYIAGSQKEKIQDFWKRKKESGEGTSVEEIDWNTLEENTRYAEQQITKENILGDVNYSEYQSKGMDSRAGFLASKVFAAIGKTPVGHDAESRKNYVIAINTLKDRIKDCKTVTDIDMVVEDIYNEATGYFTSQIERTPEVIAITEKLAALQTAQREYSLKLNNWMSDDKEGGLLYIFEHDPKYASDYSSMESRYFWKKYADDIQQLANNKADEIDPNKKHEVTIVPRSIPGLGVYRDAECNFTEDEMKAVRQEKRAETVKQREALKLVNKTHDIWKQLGEKFTDLRYSKTYQTHREYLLIYNDDVRYYTDRKTGEKKESYSYKYRKQEYDKYQTWDWVDFKTKREAKPGSKIIEGKVKRKFEMIVPDKLERIGGRDISVKSTAELKKAFNLRDVQTGSYVQSDPVSAKWHTDNLAAGFADLCDVLGIRDDQVSLNGRLALAVGARGHGKALAHYEPVERVINITKFKGGGSLGHEWFHSFDNMIAEAITGGNISVYMSDANAQSKRVRLVDAFKPNAYHDPIPDDETSQKVKSAFTNLVKAMMEGDTPETEVITYKESDVAVGKELFEGSSTHYLYYGNSFKRDLKECKTLEDAIKVINDRYKSTIDLINANAGKLSKLSKYEQKRMKDTVRNYEKYRAAAVAYFDKKEDKSQGGEGVVLTGRIVSRFYEDAKKLDAGKNNPYWSTPLEMAARSFEAYLVDKLAERNQKNDYLSGHADNTEYQGAFFPYPTERDRVKINKAFDELFEVIRSENAIRKAIDFEEKLIQKSIKPRFIIKGGRFLIKK